jgi:hypothetical protein
VPLADFPRRVEEKEEWLNRRKLRPIGDKDDHVHVCGVKRKNIFFPLPYLQVD